MAKKGPKSSEPGFQVCAICGTLARRFRKGKTFLLNFVQRKTLSGRAINDDGDVCFWPSSNVGGLWGICTSSPAVTALRALCTAHLITLLCSTVTDWIAQCFKANLHWQWRTKVHTNASLHCRAGALTESLEQKLQNFCFRQISIELEFFVIALLRMGRALEKDNI